MGFNSSLKNELLNLDDSNGAAHLLAKYHSEIVVLSTNDAGVVHDIDVPEDLKAIKRFVSLSSYVINFLKR